MDAYPGPEWALVPDTTVTTGGCSHHYDLLGGVHGFLPMLRMQKSIEGYCNEIHTHCRGSSIHLFLLMLLMHLELDYQ